MALMNTEDAFNPGVQKAGPDNWLGWSKLITTPEIDKSSEYALKGAGNFIETGIKAADTLVKENIDNEIHTKVDTERDAYTTNLSNAKLAVSNKTSVSGVPTSETDVDLLNPEGGGDDSSMPGALKKLPNAAETLGNARANGKLSETDYYGRLDSLAKDFRSRYPGYRDYIDSVFEKTTGVNPANAQIKSLIGDINSFSTGANAQRNKAEAFAVQHMRIDGMPQMLEKFRAGQASDIDLYKFGAKRLQDEDQFKYNKLVFEQEQHNKEQQGQRAEQVMLDHANNTIVNHLDALEVLGVGGTPTKLTDFIRDVQSGKIKASDAQMQQLAPVLEGSRVGLFDRLTRDFNTVITDPQSGKPTKSMAQYYGPEKTTKLINNQLTLYDEYTKNILDQKFGSAFAASNWAKAVSAGGMKTVMEDPSIGGVVTMMKIMNDAGGPVFAERIYQDVLISSLPKSDMNTMTALSAKIMGQPDLRVTGKVQTVRKALEDVKGSPEVVAPGQVNNMILDLPKKIADPETPDKVKINLARATYSRENRGMINLLPQDKKASVFADIVSEGNTKEIARLSKIEPGLWKDHVKWATDTFASEIFPKEIKDLATVPKIPGMSLSWDNIDNQFIVNKSPELNRGALTRVPTMGLGGPYRSSIDEGVRLQVKGVEESIFRLNQGLKVISNIYKQEGSDANVYIFKLLQGMGAGLPKDMLDAVVISHKKEEPGIP